MVWYQTIGSGLWSGLVEMASAPFRDASIWWYLFPMLTLWFILEIYFGQHKKEDLGWNTALANGFSLVWMNIEAMRMLFAYSPDLFWLRLFFITSIFGYGCWLIYISFSHKYNPALTFKLASPTPIYYLSIISVLWGHGLLNINWWVLIDLVLVFWVVYGLIYLLHRFMPDRDEPSKSFNSEAPDTPDTEVSDTPDSDTPDNAPDTNLEMPDLSDLKL